jgi:tRNA(Leu) C34 or U34 (ribose-2'-O)-methylase TrmL
LCTFLIVPAHFSTCRLQQQRAVLDAASKPAVSAVPQLEELLEQKQRKTQNLQVTYQEALVRCDTTAGPDKLSLFFECKSPAKRLCCVLIH